MKSLNHTFKALADSTRLRILNLLLENSACVCDLERILHLPQPLISRHLGYLHNAGLVVGHRQGMRVQYSLALEGEIGQALEGFLKKAFFTSRVFQEDLRRWKENREALHNSSLRIHGRRGFTGNLLEADYENQSLVMQL